MMLGYILNSFERLCAAFTSRPAINTNNLTRWDWSTIPGKTVRSYGLHRGVVAITFTDDTWVAVEFRNGDCTTNVVTDPGSPQLNAAIVRAGIVTQEQVTTACTQIEHKRKLLEEIKDDLRKLGAE